MNAEHLVAHYEQIADATDAIARLRRFILDLAVRGKLVPQDPNDESASELLKLIAKERNQRIDRGEMRRGKLLADLEEFPFEPPSGWIWVRLGETGNIFSGNSINDPTREQLARVSKGRPFIATKDVGYGLDHINYENGLLVELTDERFRIARAYSVFICAEGGSAGKKMGLADREICFGNKLLANETWSVVAPKFTLYAYMSEFFYEQFSSKMKGVIGGISIANFLELPLCLPPLAEQHRIVAKVDELMGLCDRLEAARANREAARDRLAAASLARLNVPDPETFLADTRFALDALPALTTRPNQLKQLRQTILSLAVRGKLVPQDPTDEPAFVRRTNDVAELEGRLDAEIPSNWRWVRVEDVANARLGKMLDKAKNKGRPYPYLRNTNVHWFDIRLDDLKTILLDDAEFAEYRLENGDVLICEGGHGIGRTAVWGGGFENLVFQKALHRVRPGRHLDPSFFAQCCFVYFDAGIMQTYFTGVGIPHFTGRALAKLVFPLPPLAEQHRIVAKVDALMSLCDRLEACLTATAATRRRLLDALLAEALAPMTDRELEAAE